MRNFLRYFPDVPEAKTECIACPKCPVGTGLTPLCGSIISNYTAIKCEPCTENETFSNTHSIESCRSCHDCGLRNIIQQCTPDQNRKCGNKCPERHFLDDNGFCQECYFCCPNVHESARLKRCKDIGMSREWQCLETHQNRLCKEIRETVENATKTATYDVTTPTPLADPLAYDLNLNLTGRASTKDTKKPVFKSEEKHLPPATTKTVVDKRSPKEEGGKVSTTSVTLIAIGATTLAFLMGAVIYFCCKCSHPDVTNPNECMPLKDMKGSDGRDGSTETVEDVLEADEQKEFLTGELRQDQPKIDLIPSDCKVSEMSQLHNHENQILLHHVQKKLDHLEKQSKKNWRSVGQILKVSQEDLDLIETDYKAGRSPTESLLGKLSTFSAVPSMRRFVEALVACDRYDVANNICNWPWDLRTVQ